MTQPATDLEIAFSALSNKKKRYDKLWQYYDGDQPLIYNSERLREIFSGLNAKFTENWCSVVIDSTLDRIEMQVPRVTTDQGADGVLRDLWESTGIVDDEYSIHEDVCVTGESFVICWPSEDGSTVEAFHNNARLVHAEYELDNPKKMRFAAKWWTDRENKVRLTMYYDDRLEYYIAKRPAIDTEISSAKMFEPYGEDEGEPVAENPFGRIPVFHFRSNQRKVKSQIGNILEVQDAINKLLSDMMVAAEFGAFPQRFVISQAGIDELRNNPNEIWDLPAALENGQGTSAGQFSATDLGNYLQAINKLSADIGVITRTPRHYFFLQTGDPSGDALITMEAPLQRKVSRLLATLRPTWRDLAQFMLELSGVNVTSQNIQVEFDPFQTIQPMTQAMVRKEALATGIPLKNSLRSEGWTDGDLAQLDQDRMEDLVFNQGMQAQVNAFQEQQYQQHPLLAEMQRPQRATNQNKKEA